MLFIWHVLHDRWWRMPESQTFEIRTRAHFNDIKKNI